MIAIGLGVLWGGYTVGIWGYCLVRGYNVPFTQLFGSTWGGGAGEGSAGPITPAAPAQGAEGSAGPIKGAAA